MFFKPMTHKDAGLPFNPIKALITPRPIGWIASKGADGSFNLAPYSFFNGISDDPAMVMFSVASNVDGSIKDSLRNVEETKEFTVNIVGKAQVEQMNISSGNFAYGDSEFDKAGLQMTDSHSVNVPRVGGIPAALECTHYQTITLPTGPTGMFYSVVLGTITGVYIDDNIIVDGKVSYDKYVPVSRLGYHDYAEINDVFSMTRPEIKG